MFYQFLHAHASRFHDYLEQVDNRRLEGQRDEERQAEGGDGVAQENEEDHQVMQVDGPIEAEAAQDHDQWVDQIGTVSETAERVEGFVGEQAVDSTCAKSSH